MSEGEALTGRVERVTFTNPDNGWTVLSVRLPRQGRPVTAVGCMPAPVAGEFIEMTGQFVDNPQFGRQFQVSRVRLLPPNTESGLKKYLGSGLIKGLGPVLAGRLVDHFGPKVLEIMDQTPERLIEVPGLGASRRETIIDGWRRNQGLKRLLEFLAEFGLGPTVGLRVIRRLGDEADRLIREDPYRLAYEIDGVGFATADKVARRLGLTEADPRRLAAGLLYALNQFADEGHVYTPERELLAAGGALLPEAAPMALREALTRLLGTGQIRKDAPDPESADYYPPRLHRAEKWVAHDLSAILRTPAAIEVPRQPQAVDWAEKALGLGLSESQRQAVALALSEKILVITGGPGTGKTTLTRAITAIFGALRARQALVAPTGRAARRLAEATGLGAKTIHRLLEYAPQVGFQRHPERKLEVDLLLVDEASMVDLPLMNQLTGAMPHTARLILVGDRDQLPSVGPGRVLADLIDSGSVAVTRLTEVHRQAEGSQIVRAAHQVRRGQAPESSQDRERGDFYFLEERDPSRILPRLLQVVTQTLPARRGFDPLEDIQVLTPMHSRDLGTEHLNQVLSERLNPQGGQGLTRFGRRFRRGDRVMQIKNNYNRDVFNGDGGRVERIDLEAQELTVNFEGRPVVYDFGDLDELALAYAITIHKAQGSEFPAVVIPLTSAHHIMLKRNLLYTALTRGRRLVVIIGSARALETAVANDREQVRRSRLALKLREN
ncbi:MAG: ATP-dependent RecD-like DNA helicase [Deltaproteobacteria bacterium]|nr:ATP-dependent RecD-like DNA helicase [Deltaproteobacteria bacterium]